jgi:uncharacterized protein (TIGR02284 family)
VVDKAHAKLSTLTELIADGEHGYKRLVDGLKDRQTVLFCLEESSVRAEYHLELARLLKAIYNDGDQERSLLGRLHHGWLELEAALHVSDRVLLGTALHCEAVAISSYELLLEEEQIEPELRQTLDRQLRHLRGVSAQLERIRDGSPDKLFGG